MELAGEHVIDQLQYKLRLCASLLSRIPQPMDPLVEREIGELGPVVSTILLALRLLQQESSQHSLDCLSPALEE